MKKLNYTRWEEEDEEDEDDDEATTLTHVISTSTTTSTDLTEQFSDSCQLQIDADIQHSAILRDNNHCGKYWFIRDVCGIVCVVITYLLILYAEFVIMFVLLLPGPNSFYSAVNASIFNILAFLALASHLKTMLTDPGAIPKGNATNLNKSVLKSMGLLRQGNVILKCPKCVSIKPERTHHCSVCQRCIKKMDHHCPWVNNCVGEGNQKHFVLFTLYIALLSMHALGLCIGQAFLCMAKDWSACSFFSPPATVIFMMFLVFEGLLFSIFTIIMFITQLQGICSDQTGIESLKKESATWSKKSYWSSMQMVFGGRFSLAWFNPLSQPYVGKPLPYLYDV